MVKKVKKEKSVTLGAIQGLLIQQTDKVEVLLSKQTARVEGLLSQQTKEVNNLLSQQTLVILDAVDKRLENFENRQDTKIDQLKISVDRFVGFYTKQEQEFTIIKNEVNRIKKVLKEKLGVTI